MVKENRFMVLMADFRRNQSGANSYEEYAENWINTAIKNKVFKAEDKELILMRGNLPIEYEDIVKNALGYKKGFKIKPISFYYKEHKETCVSVYLEYIKFRSVTDLNLFKLMIQHG